MNKYITYNIVPEMNLIVEYYWGQINIMDVKQQKTVIKSDPLFEDTYNVITDFRDTKLEMSHNDILCYVENLMQSNMKTVRVVFLTETPEQVVYTTLFKLHTAHLPIKIDIVNGLSAAINWLGFNNSSVELLNAIINKLKKKLPSLL